MATKPEQQLTTLSTLGEVADRLNIALNSVRSLVDEGELKTVQVGRRSVRIRDRDVEDFITRKVAQKTEA